MGVRSGGLPRIQSLDGLRAIAILLVVWGHARGTPGFPERLRAMTAVGDVANMGVHVFFVVSGYLITTLLVAERRGTGTVRLGSFYARRAFRIFPAFYFYLAAAAALALAGVVHLPWLDLAVAGVYLMNFLPHRAWVVGHSWSLSVEEQFYMIWPAVFRAAGERLGLRIALGVVALGPVIRLLWASLAPSAEHRNMISEVFPTVADSLAAGCALALLGPWLSANERYRRWLRSPALGAGLVATLAFCVWFGSRHAWASWLVLQTTACVAIALLVDRCVRCPDGLVGRALNWRPLSFLGTTSYSLYLWQQVFLAPAAGREPAVWTRFPLNVFLAFGAALASYYLVERPFLRMRDRVLAREEPARAGKAA